MRKIKNKIMPQEIAIKNLIFVDCEGHGPAPTLNDPESFEFGAVAYPSRQTFHGTGATKETFERILSGER